MGSGKDMFLNLKIYETGREILFFDEIDSTNSFAKENINCLKNGAVIVAKKQYAGRGRLGRQWLSFNEDGLWMSILVKDKIKPENIPMISLATACAVSRAIEESTGVKVGVKWPNDIIINKKKLGGILCESILKGNDVVGIVIGIGLNVNQVSFQNEISNIAVSLKQVMGKDVSKENVIIKILELFEKRLELIKNEKFIEIINEWKQLDVIIGCEVKFKLSENNWVGEVLDINDDGSLKIKLRDSNKEVNLKYGEITIRGLYDYV